MRPGNSLINFAGSISRDLGSLTLGKHFDAKRKTCSTLTDNAAGMSVFLKVLQWARANGCAWSEATCSRAARGGHLHVLEWARGQGCPWDASTCMAAAEGETAIQEVGTWLSSTYVQLSFCCQAGRRALWWCRIKSPREMQPTAAGQSRLPVVVTKYMDLF